MAAGDRTPPIAEAAASSSPLTPNPKRAKMGSPDYSAKTPEESQSTEGAASAASAAAVQQSAADDNALIDNPKDTKAAPTLEPTSAPAIAEEEDEEEDLEADDEYADSAFGTDNSDSTSITSSIYHGYMENGRRYQSKREGEYWVPSDEKQFQSQQKAHILHHILDSGRKNPFFYSPIPDTAQNILDIGTGTGDWARDVADQFPSAFVQGVDLSPPPNDWVPPNCKLEVDDALKPWEFKENGKFDLVHMRYMYGAFTDEQWRLLYKQAYKNLAPGGWIEQLEGNITYECDDNTLPADSLLAGLAPMFYPLCEKTGKKIDTEETFKAKIKAAGFTNIQEKVYKVPVGNWAKNPILKEAGEYHKAQLMEGFEGYSMFLLTHFGEPTPWTPEEVQVYVAKGRAEMNNPAFHGYNRFRRVWAQKPYDTEAIKNFETAVQNVA